MLGGLAASTDVSAMARREYVSFELARSYCNLDPIAGVSRGKPDTQPLQS
jgi:hypothetical protein